MPVVVVPKHVVLSSSVVPELRDYMDQNIWIRFANSIRSADESGTCMACAVEWGCCLLTGVWCIFCCHACIADSINESKWRQEAMTMNHAYFGGRPVFSIGANFTVVVNTDNIGPMTAAPAFGQPQYAPAQPQYAPAQPQYAPAQPQYAPAQPVYAAPQQQQYPPMAQAVPVNNGPRFVNVVVPQGVPPGSSITVTTPDNTTLQVTIPPGVGAGQEIKVQY